MLLRQKVDMIYTNKAERIDGEWILNLHQQLPPSDNWMWELATSPPIVAMLRAQIGPNIVLYCSQLHTKFPVDAERSSASVELLGRNSAVPWHQDGNVEVRTLWIALDDVSPESGGLRLIRGGHKKGRVPYAPVATEEELQCATYFARNNVFRINVNENSEEVVEYRFNSGS